MSEEFYNNRIPLDDTFYGNNYNAPRRGRAILILCCLESNNKFKVLDAKTKMYILKKIERSCYNKTCRFISKQGQALNWDNIQFVNYYNITALRIQKNLESNIHNTDIIDSICKCENISNIAFMKSHELQPDVSKHIYDVIAERKKQKIKKKISTQHKCYSCGFNRTTEQEIQSRSLDEGSTLIITCETEGCNNKWTFSS